MNYLKIYKERVVNKIISNKTNIKMTKYSDFKIEEVNIRIKYKKNKKEIIEFFELLAFIEQLSGEKAFLKTQKIKEKQNIINIKESLIEVKLRNKRAITFVNNFIYLNLGERKNFNLIEENNVDLLQKKITFRYKNLKIFRKFFLNNYANMNTKLQVEISYKKKGKERVLEDDFIFYLQRKNEFQIK